MVFRINVKIEPKIFGCNSGASRCKGSRDVEHEGGGKEKEKTWKPTSSHGDGENAKWFWFWIYDGDGDGEEIIIMGISPFSVILIASTVEAEFCLLAYADSPC